MTAEPVPDPDILHTTYAEQWRRLDRVTRERIGATCIAFVAACLQAELPSLPDATRDDADREADRLCAALERLTIDACPLLREMLR